MANARKFGRKLEDFDKIYEKISNVYLLYPKTNEEMQKIMKEILPQYGLKYIEINDENILKDYIKRGIKCLTLFRLNNIECDNLNTYYKDNSIEKDKKLLTLEILEKQNNKNIIVPNETIGHALILLDIDEDGNYILINSFGKEWGNNGIFKTKKECLKESVYFAVYFTEEDLTDSEKNSWIKLKEDIKKYLAKMKCIRCPVCKRSSNIEFFEKIFGNKWKCPYKEKCEFEIDINNELDFITGKLCEYDLDNNKTVHKKFDLGFG